MYFYQLTLLLNVNILYLIATHHDQTDSHSCRTENARATYQQSPVDSQNLKNVLVDAGGRPTYYDLLPCNNLDNRMHTRYSSN